MQYQSTGGAINKISSAEAIVSGLSGDGGLFVPGSFPQITLETIIELSKKSYAARAAYIMSLYLSDFTQEELTTYSNSAYSVKKGTSGFTDHIAPLYGLNDNTHFLELWHGPTCAFKDMALQVMPLLLTASLKKINEKRKVCILVATSGDTGKAALEGFKDIENTKIMVFYPENGVSEVQKIQMTTQKGNNVNVVSVEGNFDDSQTGVKEIFKDKAFIKELDNNGVFLSSANSINWGRLVPQIVYYISAYCDLITGRKIKPGEKINFCVPTGNFGNILAAYYAEKMGLPVNKLICASNRNDVLTQFINTGVYDKNRPFYTTVSPSMDILVSSNLERLLYELSEKDGNTVTSYMKSLSENGNYKITPKTGDELNRIFSSGYCTEEETMQTIKNTYKNDNYLIDTHTAVAYKVLNDYKKSTGDKTVSVVVSTASPFKFCGAVINALDESTGVTINDDITMIEKLSDMTGCNIPDPLKGLKNEKQRFTETVSINKMKDSVKRFIQEG